MKTGTKTIRLDDDCLYARVTADFEGNGYVHLAIGALEEGEWIEEYGVIIDPGPALALGCTLEAASEDSRLGWTPDDGGAQQQDEDEDVW